MHFTQLYAIIPRLPSFRQSRRLGSVRNLNDNKVSGFNPL